MDRIGENIRADFGYPPGVERDSVHPGEFESLDVERGVLCESYNIGSLQWHMFELLDVVHPRTEVILLQETKVTDRNLQTVLKHVPEGWKFLPFHRRSNVMGGGLGVMFRAYLNLEVLKGKGRRGDGLSPEWMWVVLHKGTASFCLGNIYSPPSVPYECPDLWDELADIVGNLGFRNICLCGDLNFNGLAKSISGRGRYWYDNMTSFGLTRGNDLKPTHFQGRCPGTMLDYVFGSTEIIDMSRCWIVGTLWDHYGLRFFCSKPSNSHRMTHSSGNDQLFGKKIAFRRLRDGVDNGMYRRQFVREINRRSLAVLAGGSSKLDNFHCLMRDILEVGEKVCGLSLGSNYVGLKDVSNSKYVESGACSSSGFVYAKLPYWSSSLSSLVRKKRKVRRRIRRAGKKRLWRWRRYWKRRANFLSAKFRKEIIRSQRNYYRLLKGEVAKKKHIPGYMFWWLRDDFSGTRALKNSRAVPVPFSNELMNGAWGPIMASQAIERIQQEEDLRLISTYFAQMQCCGEERRDRLANKELVEVLLRMPSGKAPGLDNVPYEVLKLFKGQILGRVRGLFNELLFGRGVIPDGWKMALIRLIPKSQDPLSPLEFRPITLLSSIAKWMEGIVLNRLKKWISDEKCQDFIHNLQGGFVEGRGCLEQAWLLQQIADEAYCSRRCVYAAFLDIEKAYDSVPHCRVLAGLVRRGVPFYIVDYVRHWIFGHKRVLDLPNNKVELCVRRGVPHSSLMFSWMILSEVYFRVDGV